MVADPHRDPSRAPRRDAAGPIGGAAKKPGAFGPRPAGDFLADILRQAGRSKERSGYNEALDQIFSAAQRPHVQVLGCRAGKLVLEVDSAPLFSELSGFRRDEIRLRINQLVPEQPIAQLAFRLGGTGHV